VYGGTLEQVGGQLTDKMGMVTIPTTANRWYSGYGGYYYVDSSVNATSANRASVVCNMFPTVADRDTLGVYVDAKYIYFARVNTAYPTLTDWLSFLSNNDVQLVCPLATPQTYQLTPTEIALLKGRNNVWTDSGEVEVTYKADVGLYIDKKLNG
jgi:hypothetical protein